MRKSVITTAVAAALFLGACSENSAVNTEATNAVATQVAPTTAQASASNV